MIHNILFRVKKLLDIEDDSLDTKLILLIESAMGQFRSYMHNNNLDGLEYLLAQYVGHLYMSGEGDGSDSPESGGSASSSSSSGVTPVLGELKAESYSGVKFEYTTSADFTNKSSSSQKSATTSSGDIATYFNTMIAPHLRSRRRIVTLSHPYVEESPERY